MNSISNNEKIERYLSELATEYKELLYKALLERSATFDELSVTDLLRIDSEIKKPLRKDYGRELKRRRMYLFTGTIYFFVGLIGFLITLVLKYSYPVFSTIPNTSTIQLVSLAIGLLGLFISIFSFAYPYIMPFSKKSAKGMNNIELEYEVVIKWRALEGIVNDLVMDRKLTNTNSIIQFLVESELINTEEQGFLKDFLRLRNEIVHSTDQKHSNSEIKELLSKVDKIILRLHKLL